MSAFHAAAAIALCLLSACSATPVESVSVCPPIHEFSLADQQTIAKEYDALSDQDPLKAFVQEEVRLRAVLRACRQP